MSLDPLQTKRFVLVRYLQLFAVSYFFLFMLTSQFSIYFEALGKSIEWFGKTVFHLPEFHKITDTGSGDTQFDYVLVSFTVTLAMLISLALLLIFRRRNNFDQLYKFTIVIARYYVAFTMLTYGFAKLFDGQFPALGYSRLEQKVGDMSPMGIVWTFMGASRSYTFISGLLEFIGGILLLWRRTTTFGALFSLTVMLNVALLNYNYDVPVKIFSTHIVLICLLILSYAYQPLIQFFILHQPAQLSYRPFVPKKKWMLITMRSVKYLMIAGMLYTMAAQMWPTLEAPKYSPIEGAYTVKAFNVESGTPMADSLRWEKFFITYPDGLSYQYNQNKKKRLETETDVRKKEITLKKDSVIGRFSYQLVKDTLLLKGKLNQREVSIKAIRKLKKDYSINNRGFHWVNDYPPNW